MQASNTAAIAAQKVEIMHKMLQDATKKIESLLIENAKLKQELKAAQEFAAPVPIVVLEEIPPENPSTENDDILSNRDDEVENEYDNGDDIAHNIIVDSSPSRNPKTPIVSSAVSGIRSGLEFMGVHVGSGMKNEHNEIATESINAESKLSSNFDTEFLNLIEVYNFL